MTNELESLREENKTLRALLLECGRNAGGFLSDDVSIEFLKEIPKEISLIHTNYKRLQNINETQPKQPSTIDYQPLHDFFPGAADSPYGWNT